LRMAMRMRMLFGRRRESTRLDDELGFHLDRLIAENIASGMSRDQARAAAMREAWRSDGVDVLDPNRPAAQPN